MLSTAVSIFTVVADGLRLAAAADVVRPRKRFNAAFSDKDGGFVGLRRVFRCGEAACRMAKLSVALFDDVQGGRAAADAMRRWTTLCYVCLSHNDKKQIALLICHPLLNKHGRTCDL